MTCLEQNALGEFQNVFFSPPTSGSKKLFSGLCYEKLVGLLDIKFMKAYGPLCDWVLLENLSPKFVHNESSAIW